MPLISPLLWQGLLRGLSVAAIIGSQRSVSQARWIGPECAGTGRPSRRSTGWNPRPVECRGGMPEPHYREKRRTGPSAFLAGGCPQTP